MGLINKIFSMLWTSKIATGDDSEAPPIAELSDLMNTMGLSPQGQAHDVTYQSLVDTYKNWVYTCVNKIAYAIAVLPFELYSYKQGSKRLDGYIVKAMLHGMRTKQEQDFYLRQKGIEKEQVLEHPFLDVYNKPNFFDTRFTFTMNLVLRLETAGYCGVYMPKNSLGLPGELWCLPLMRTGDLRPVASTTNIISGYIYTDGSMKTLFDPSEIVYIKYPSLVSPFEGMSPIKAQLYPYNIDNYILVQQDAIFKNKSTFGNVFTTEQKLQKAQVTELKSLLQSQYSGAVRTGKPIFLHSGLKLDNGKLGNNGDPIFKDVADYVKNKVVTGYNLTIPKLTGESANRSALDALDKTFIDDCIRPKTMLIEEYFERFVLPLYDSSLTLDFILPKNSQRDLDIQEKHNDLVDSVITINEARADQNRGPVPWGDSPWIPFSLSQIGSTSGDLSSSEETKNLLSTKALTAAFWTKDRRNRVARIFAEKIEVVKNIFIEDIHSFFLSQFRIVTEKLMTEGKAINGSILGFAKQKVRIWLKENNTKLDSININVEEDTKRLLKLLLPKVKNIINDTAKSRLTELGVTIEFRFDDPGVEKFLGQKLYKHSKDINEITFKEVNAILKEGFQEGMSTFEMSQMLREKFESWTTYRTQTISRTETISATNFSDLEAVNQSGLQNKLAKFWLSEVDARDTHLEAANKYTPENPIQIDEYFEVGGDRMMYPGGGSRPEENINCRCTLGYVEKEVKE